MVNIKRNDVRCTTPIVSILVLGHTLEAIVVDYSRPQLSPSNIGGVRPHHYGFRVVAGICDLYMRDECYYFLLFLYFFRVLQFVS